MSAFLLPKAFSSVIGLGSAAGFYPLRRQKRWTNLVLAVLFLVGAGLVFLYTAYTTYNQWQQHGPAVISQYIVWPILIITGLILLGSILAWSAYTSWGKSVVVYQNGFAYYDYRGLRAWRWQDVTSLRAAVTQHFASGIYIGTSRRYTLVRTDGGKLVLDNAFVHVEELATIVEQNTFPRLYEQAVQHYNVGQVLVFGPIAFNAKGIWVRNKGYRWSEVQQVLIRKGFLQLSLRRQGRLKHEKIAVSLISNLKVMLSILNQLVGVKVG